MLVCYCVCIGLSLGYWALCLAYNRRSAELPEEDEAGQGFSDLSDFKQIGFKYTT